ncbi:MAG: PorP/SprF family type IX secretion system membrane protein [Paludibacteraceae bacterium]|nr:PorP/SprF family type IX secretion system membrane protein [Paludibacteraceae bacterium]
MKKYLVGIFLSLSVSIGVYGQHEVAPSMTSQIFSRMNFNPAGMGNSDNINVFSQTRLQWIGYGDGAPKSTVLNASYFHEKWKSGFGITFTYDEIGYSNKALIGKIAYAYNLDLNDHGLLSFGVSGGINQFAKDFSDDTYDAATGATLADSSKINPDFDFGIEYSTPHFLIGASVSHIGMMDDLNTYTPMQSYYAYMRGSINLNEMWQLSPSALYMNSGKSNVVDFGCVGFYNGLDVESLIVWGGLNFNFNFFTTAPQTALMIGCEWKKLRIGYAYEMGFKIANYNTHELMLSFGIPTHSNSSAPSKKKKRR